MLPLTFKLRDVPVLVVGAGAVGARKAAQLIEAGARVTVITSAVGAALPEGVHQLHVRPYEKGDLDDFFLVVSATGRADVNDLIVTESTRARVWLNVVDDPGRSSFYFMALHREGELTVAVSTDGAAPALAQEVRNLIAASLPEGLGRVARTLRDERRALHEHGESTEGRDWRGRVCELLETREGGDSPTVAD